MAVDRTVLRLLWQKLRSWNPGERRFAFEATCLLALIWIGLRCCSFSRLRQFLHSYARHFQASNRVRPSPAAIASEVIAAGARLPVHSTCLMDALATGALLERHGYRSELRLGARLQGPRRPHLLAHAWIEHDGQVVIGHLEDLTDYRILSRG